MAETIVAIRDAAKAFGSKEVLSGVTLDLHAGEVLGVIGPNGGGKSTLLLMVAGLIKPTSGTVTVCGVPAHRLAVESAGLVGLVMARPGLYPLLTGWENLFYFGGLFGLGDDEIRSQCEPLLDSFGLGESMYDRLSTWSTGMQQKLSLVRALMLSPRLLLFDEPTANLDPLAANVLYEELRRRADDGLGCVLVTHSLAAAESICDRVVIIEGGVRDEIELDGPRELPRGPLLDAWEEAVSS